MSLYLASVYIHILSAIFLVGYLLFLVTMVGPIARRFEPAAGTRLLKEIRLKFSGLGYASLSVLVVTGIYLLSYRGGMLSFGLVLGTKLLLVAGIISYELFLGPKNPAVVWGVSICAFLVIALSVLLVRAPGLF